MLRYPSRGNVVEAAVNPRNMRGYGFDNSGAFAGRAANPSVYEAVVSIGQNVAVGDPAASRAMTETVKDKVAVARLAFNGRADAPRQALELGEVEGLQLAGGFGEAVAPGRAKGTNVMRALHG